MKNGKNKKSRDTFVYIYFYIKEVIQFLVPRTGLELAHPCEHQPLKLACLPISPSGHYITYFADVSTNRPAGKQVSPSGHF
jgi:hypothetical protein